MSRSGMLPHGQVAFADVRDAILRDRIMKLGENDEALAKILVELKKEIAELKLKAR